MTRDEKGRFVQGHAGTGGRPPRKVEEEYLDIVKKRVTPEKFAAVVDKAYEMAVRGDPAARKFLADYLMGLPVQQNDINLTGEVSLIVWDIQPPASKSE